MPPQTFLANEYMWAPRHRSDVQQVVVPAGGQLDITDLFPTRQPAAADVGGVQARSALSPGPFVRLIAAYNNRGQATPPVELALTDDVGTVVANYPFIQTGAASINAAVSGLHNDPVPRATDFANGIIFHPRRTVAGTGLDTPSGLADANFVFLINSDGGNTYNVWLTFERPTLDFTQTRTRSRMAWQYHTAPRERRILQAAAALAFQTNLDITPLIPTRADLGLEIPYLDLFVVSDFQPIAPAFETPVMVAVTDDTDAVPLVAQQNSYAPGLAMLNGELVTAIRGIMPRVDAAATTLPGGERIFARNNTAATAANVAIFMEFPSLRWD